MKRRDFHETPDPLVLLRPRRKIVGMSAILLPFTAAGAIDWEGFARHVERTFGCGLVPAVNMDTGFAALLPPEERTRALEIAQGLAAGREYIAGAFVADSPGDAFALDAYRREIDLVRAHGGTPIIFPSYGLTGADPTVIFGAFASIARHCPRFFAFELGEMFLPSGKIFPMDVFAGLLDLPECVGAKHSSLRRDLEWQRLTLRNWRRPDFLI
ncbi:MAG TPA: dihydrodipicolinate synthase family protein, partial [Planctomycetia bacterium]|nr:dihydrodipicolinate synthase family protein [Planctomycetia bacterium]